MIDPRYASIIAEHIRVVICDYHLCLGLAPDFFFRSHVRNPVHVLNIDPALADTADRSGYLHIAVANIREVIIEISRIRRTCLSGIHWRIILGVSQIGQDFHCKPPELFRFGQKVRKRMISLIQHLLGIFPVVEYRVDIYIRRQRLLQKGVPELEILAGNENVQ